MKVLTLSEVLDKLHQLPSLPAVVLDLLASLDQGDVNTSVLAKKISFDQGITAKILKRHHRIFEVPISYYGREVNEGKKIRWYEAPKAAWALLKYRFVD